MGERMLEAHDGRDSHSHRFSFDHVEADRTIQYGSGGSNQVTTIIDWENKVWYGIKRILEWGNKHTRTDNAIYIP
jgi:hypothetical protein